MATTASLELINPYAKFGLKRRPTYEKIANLIGENEQEHYLTEMLHFLNQPFRIIERPTNENIRQANERDNDETGSTQKRTHICSS